MASRTYGENKVSKLLKQITQKGFFAVEEPMIPNDRGGSHPDFIVVSQYRGVYVIEVKDWVEFILEKCDQKTMYVRQRGGEITHYPNPMDTARGYATDLHKRLEQQPVLLHSHGGKQKVSFPWKEVVILPNISKAIVKKFYDAGIWSHGTVIAKEDLNSAESFKSALDNIPMTFPIKTPLDRETLDVIRATVNPQIIVKDQRTNEAKGILTNPQSKMIRERLGEYFLTPEAKETADSMHIRLVRGVAGSGKTLVLLRRADYLQQEYPQAKILIMTFNKDLMEDTRRRLDGSNVEVINFHMMCSKIFKASNRKWQSPLDVYKWLEHKEKAILRENQLDIQFVSDEIAWRKEARIHDTENYLNVERHGRGKALQRPKRIVLDTIFQKYIQHQKQLEHNAHPWADWQDIPDIALNLLQKSSHSLRHSYDIIMLDEAQDFAPAWMEVVQHLLNPDGSLFICDDPTQSLFRNFTWAEKGVEVRGRTRILRTPFRSTRQITETAHALIQSNYQLKNDPDILAPSLNSSYLRDGDSPKLIACRNQDLEIQWVKHYIQTSPNPEKFAVLIHNHKMVKHFASLRDHYSYIESFNKMKGLEFETVIIPFLDSMFTKSNDEDETETANNLRKLFTAMTRATDNLILTYNSGLPSVLKPILETVYREYP